MRNIFVFWGVLLLVNGVFGDDVTVSVMEGDSVTLKPLTEIPEDDTAQWWFGDKIIARVNKASGLFSTSEGDDVGFNDRLKLDHQTGSLTITNTTTDHFGLYRLKIKTTAQTLHDIFSVIVRDVVTSLSVMEGDTVTLQTGVHIQRDDQIWWKFGDQDLNGPGDTRWRNIDQNNESGDLTIRNIQTDQSGDYELEINTTSMILHRKLHIDISGKMKTVSVKEGEYISLHTGLIEMQGYGLILCKFEDHLIAGITKRTNGFSTYDSSAGGRFKGRLQMHPQILSLTISNSRITDSGDYHLNMISTSHTVQRTISVTVSGVFGGNVTVMEGDSVTLKPDTEIPEDDSAQWWFGDKIIARVNKTAGLFTTSEGDNVGFKDRLKLDHQTGSLTITNSRTDHTGLYELQIRGRTETFKIFSVTIRGGGSDRSGAVSGISGASVVLMVWAVTFFFTARSISNQGKDVSVKIK